MNFPFFVLYYYIKFKNDMDTIKTWAGVNKNGFLMLFTKEPKRNTETNKWEGEPYVNSVIYKMLTNLVEKAGMNWDNDAEYFEFEIK